MAKIVKVDSAKLEIPNEITNPESKIKYRKGKFLGRGGFAKCFEVTDISSKKTYACKVISKTQLVKDKHKAKIGQEITIHRSIDHEHIVKFYSYFEDSNFVYIILELCPNRSLMEMQKRRKRITEPELRYYTRQIAMACAYLHESKIVHRDLKLGNLFLGEDMDVKVGDFGLATILNPGEHRKTLCGTPNYIAPEILMESGHGFEVDVWSLGCIVYTMIVGKPPFETEELRNTYRRIKKNDYTIPSDVNPHLANFIHKLLQADPLKRPTMKQILNDPYLTDNYIPSCLPTSCLSIAPRVNSRISILPGSIITNTNNLEQNGQFRRPFLEMENNPNKNQALINNNIDNHFNKENLNDQPRDCYLSELMQQIKKLLLSSKCKQIADSADDECEHPASLPYYWVSKWVDYTDKYGLGYALCDNSIGVLFNDATRLILMPDQTNLHYIDKKGQEEYYQYDGFAPDNLFKKITLFRYFRNYMNTHLVNMGEKQKQDLGEKEEMVRVPYIKTWFRTSSAIVFLLNNGSVQINFFRDHVKLILCPHMGAITRVVGGVFKAYKFSLLEQYGIEQDLYRRLKYAKEVVEHLQKSFPTNAAN